MPQSIWTLYNGCQVFLDPSEEAPAYADGMASSPIGAWVRAARQHAKLTGGELGERLGTSKANVSHWETGKHEPSFYDLLRIQDITGFQLMDVRPDKDWPLKNIRRERITSLNAAQLEALEAGIEGILSAISTVPSRKRQIASA